ncbi:MAG: hypothetical protein WC939_00410 [Acholeplasmataceae bacterium]
MSKMNYELLEGTESIKVVTPRQFTRALYDNETRGYNYHKVNFYDDYISLSAPLPHGVHHTLVLTKSTFEEYYEERSTIREYYADFLEQDYIPLVEEKTFEKAISYIKEQQDTNFSKLKYEDFKEW